MKKTLTALTLALIASVASAQKKTITVSVFPDLDTVVKAAIPGFQKTHPDIDIKVVSLAYADHHNALTTALSTGSGAGDVVAVDFGYVARFAEGGGLEDLNKAPYNAGSLKGRFVSYTFPQATFGGRLVAMPTDIGPGTMVYRTDLLAKAGVKPADLNRSWDAYIANGKKVVAANPGTFLIPDASEVAQIYSRTNIPAGQGLYFDAKNNVLVSPTNPRFMNACTLAKSVRDNKLDARAGGAFSPEWTTAFQKGNLATEFSGAWLVGHMQNWLAKDFAGKWNAQQLPGNTFASWGGSFYAIPTQSKNKGDAWEFIKYLTTNRDQQVLAFKTTGAFPALTAANNAPLFNEGVPYLANQKARTLWRTAATRIKPIDVNRLDPVADEIFLAELGNVLDGSKTCQQALTDAKGLIERRARR
ncbi:ABC transporter substrate-binding protein [Deinococcus hopiensis]|uniref:Carbohydrate ABC transporter substrate-binding protein, CUT1 family n=1 Tax=Deinococcus hopiensis KR-140 TaxID=695939 RepID=A0A1W1UUN3_9DEIO|nr:extracellular solute-binding protein [Deinococcus hopiensis]SMB80300.1 carbohydrate ABC transporter substrate-binding protein, CUT1 family [Deinococcus hopiensis KR-140]SMB84746.1 multiple sugar transport system substrate-binding protein [Deinococcus hopiensis KR-140]